MTALMSPLHTSTVNEEIADQRDSLAIAQVIKLGITSAALVTPVSCCSYSNWRPKWEVSWTGSPGLSLSWLFFSYSSIVLELRSHVNLPKARVHSSRLTLLNSDVSNKISSFKLRSQRCSPCSGWSERTLLYQERVLNSQICRTISSSAATSEKRPTLSNLQVQTITCLHIHAAADHMQKFPLRRRVWRDRPASAACVGNFPMQQRKRGVLWSMQYLELQHVGISVISPSLRLALTCWL